MSEERAKLLQKPRRDFPHSRVNEIPNDIHKSSINVLEEIFDTSVSTGLSKASYARNLHKFGPNVLREPETTPLYIIYLKQHLLSNFNIIASIAMVATVIMGLFRGFEPDDISFIVVITTIILFTSCFTFYSDVKRSNVMSKLQSMGAVASALVKRSGVSQNVKGDSLVPGDIIMLDSGDRVPADIIVLDSKNLKVDNSSMTGESLPVKKSNKATSDEIMLSENVVLYSTHIMEGRMTGLIIATANDTKLSKLFNFETGKEVEETPMIKEINKFMYLSIGLAVLVCSGLMIAAIIQKRIVAGIVFAITIIISCIPEGLIINYLCAETITANRVQQKSVHIKKLKACELFGNLTTLFMDKTGTITENKLHVWNFIDGNSRVIKADNFTPNDYPLIFSSLVLGSDSSLVQRLLERGVLEPEDFLDAKGNALETSVLQFAYRKDAGRALSDLLVSSRVYTMPFNSKNKYSYAIVDIFSDQEKQELQRRMLFAKGAPEYLIKLCVENQAEGFFDSQMRSYLKLSGMGERGVALACTDLTHSYPIDYDFDANPIDLKQLSDLNFSAIVSMRDKIRDYSKNTIMNLRSAGISIIMVTGDHPGTATYVARHSGIILAKGPTADQLAEKRGVDILSIDPSETSSIVLTGEKIEKLPLDRLREIFINYPEVVVARCTPEHKIIAISAMKSINDIDPQILRKNNITRRCVGVIGDGTNDAPSLKMADIGISMGGNVLLVTYSALGMQPTDIFHINKYFMDDSLIMVVNNQESFSYKVRMDLRVNGILEYMKMNILIQMVMLVLTKTRRVSIFHHGIFNNDHLNAAFLMNIAVCLIITFVQIRVFHFIELGLTLMLLVGFAVVIYGSLLTLIFDEVRKLATRRFNFFDYKPLMYHVYA
ncbi:MAG: Sodium/potassium-transporting ATPase subunit alpha-1 [Marteilia pararefringens]